MGPTTAGTVTAMRMIGVTTNLSLIVQCNSLKLEGNVQEVTEKAEARKWKHDTGDSGILETQVILRQW